MKAVASALVGGLLASLAGASTLAMAPAMTSAAPARPETAGAQAHAASGLYKTSVQVSEGVCRPPHPGDRSGHAAACGCALCVRARA